MVTVGGLHQTAAAGRQVVEYLRANAPQMLYDLPTGGRRLVQTANGYQATFVSGELVMEQGKATGALPGRLVRGGFQ